METAPLTLAHNHARNAANETKQHNHLAASEEHELAAAEFAAAAKETSDQEALRILNLLEQHHKKLGEIIKTRHEKPKQEEVEENPVVSETPASVAADTLKQEAKRTLSSPDTAIHPPRLPRTGRSTTRELSSSIASNLASARGIPSNRQKRPAPISPLVSDHHADGQITQDDGRRKYSTSQPSSTSDRPSWAPPLPSAQAETDSSANDAPFQQFYSAFEGLMSKLSAPLAFTGLPLTGASRPEIPAAQPTPKSPIKASKQAEINYSQMISRAALRAVDDPRGNYSVAESWYDVPTSGGTMTYAESLTRRDRAETHALRQHTRIPSILSNISEDDFVDARSTILNQQSGKHKGSNEPKVDGRTMEELALNNHQLRSQLDTIARRLQVFEMSSQTSTAALAQSIRLMPKSPLSTPEASRTHTKGTGTAGKQFANDALSARVTELEEVLKKNDQKARKRDEENAKLRETLGKYREKWDNLKAGAKARREGQNRDRGEGASA